MVNKPKVSVIIPIYNVEQYLDECLNSVINQTLKEIEIICVNDGSTDNSLQIIQKYQETDDRIIVISNENNGYGYAVNQGIKSSTGEYVGIVESDDVILPDMYEELYNVSLQYSDIDIIKGDYYRFFNDNIEDRKCVSSCPDEKMYNRKMIISDNPDCYRASMCNPMGIYKNEVIQKCHIRLNETPGASFQDNGLWYQLFTKCNTIYYLKKAFYLYRIDREGSSSNSCSYENAMCIFDEWNQIYSYTQKYNESERTKYLPIFILRMFDSCIYHFNRIPEEYKLSFLLKLSSILNQYKNNNDLKCDYLKPYQCSDLLMIMDNPRRFYHEWYAKRFAEEIKKDDLLLLQDTKVKLKNSLKYTVTNDEDSFVSISVIIPVFNAEQTIRKCLNSVLQQNLEDIEIICIDDGSTDRSSDIIYLYTVNHKNIRLILQENSGPGAARNAGLSIARGKYIAFMDPDDEYPNNESLRKLYLTAEEKGVLICGGNTIVAQDGVIKKSEDICFSNSSYIEYTDYQNEYGYTAYIYNREFLKNNNIIFPDLRRYQDPPFFVKAMNLAKRFYALDFDVYLYNYAPGHVAWNERKVTDLVKGITECIRLSSENNLEIVFSSSIRKIEQEYCQRIIEYGASASVIRELAVAEYEINCSPLLRKTMNASDEGYKLKIIDKLLEKIANKSKKGYIGPNAFKDYMNLKNECDSLKCRILAVECSLSYRMLVALKGGKKKCEKKGLWVSPDSLFNKGICNDINRLKKDRDDLSDVLDALLIARGIR